MKPSINALLNPAPPYRVGNQANSTPSISEDVQPASTASTKRDCSREPDSDGNPKRARKQSLSGSEASTPRDFRLAEWRRTVEQNAYVGRLEEWAKTPAPDENRADAVTNIKCWLNNPDDHLNLRGLNLIMLPELPKGVSKIDAAKNRISTLEALPDTLEELDLDHNLLATVPVLPAGMTNFYAMNNMITALTEPLPPNLEWLGLNGNLLESLPILPATLVQLNLSDNALESLPAAIPQNLLEFHVNNNHLTDLPDSIASLPAGCEVDVDGNELSPEVAMRIEELITTISQADPSRGPEIEFSLGGGDKVETLPLVEQVDSWFEEQGYHPVNAELETWESFQNACPENADALSALLGRMRETAHYIDASTDMVPRVVDALKYLTKHADAREICAAIAVEGTRSCDDRIALAFVEMEEVVINHYALHAGLKQDALIEVGTGMFRSQLLKDIANKKANSIRTASRVVDRTEIILRYWVALSGASQLNLPSKMNAMIFENMAQAVTADDIAVARQEVDSISMSPKRNEFLGTWHPWKTYMQKHYPNEFEITRNTIATQENNLSEALAEAMVKLENQEADQGSELSPQCLELKFQIGEMRTRYSAIEPALMGELTTKILEGACKVA